MLMAESRDGRSEYLGSYMPLLIYAGLAYLIAFAAIQLLVPRMEPAPAAAAG
jgi:ACS family hexuronate transporter-like MFS transporter